MASKTKKRGSSALDSLMAGFAAGAAAFIFYAMPQAQFDEAVGLSGLPMLVPAAQAPLGMTARLAVMAAAGLGTFLLVWFVLRALGKPAAAPRKHARLEEIEVAPPRLRRADMHPDAPSRRPLLAGVELGRSFDELSAEEPIAEEQSELQEEDEPFAEGQPLYDRAIYGELPAEEPEAFVERASWQTEAAAEDSPETFDTWAPERFDELAEADEQVEAFAPASGEPVEEWEEPQEPAFDERMDESFEQEQPIQFAPRAVDPVESLSSAYSGLGNAGMTDLMQRLEAGLARRRPNTWVEPAREAANGHAAAPSSGHLDARLRGAIDELQKLASRGN